MPGSAGSSAVVADTPQQTRHLKDTERAFSMQSVRSVTEDRTARAIIRDEALRLFAEEGPERVTIRQVAAAAGVSSALVIHHFGSKEGLQDAVDRRVLDMVESLLDQLTARAGDGLFDQGQEAAGSLAKAMTTLLPAGSPHHAYLRRLLVSDSEVGKQIFARLYCLATATLSSLVEAGVAAPGDDRAVRAAFLMVNDLAVLLLRERLTEALGFDPISEPGRARWGAEVLAIYSGGLRPTAPGGPQPGSPAGRRRQGVTRVRATPASSTPRSRSKGDSSPGDIP